MSRTRLATLALAAVALAGGVTWALTAGPQPGTSRTASVAVRGVLPSTAPTPGGPGAGRDTGAAGIAGKHPEKATAGQSAGRLPTDPARHPTPAPFIQTFAGQPGVTRQKPKQKPTTPVKVAPAVDGCDRAYGTIAQCIPVRFPAGVTDKCAWLRDHGFKDLKVTGRDRQNLDPDRNDTACDQ